MGLASWWVAAGRRKAPEETPPTTQNRDAVRRRARALQLEQKRNVRQPLAMRRAKSLRTLTETVKRPVHGVQGQIGVNEICWRRG